MSRILVVTLGGTICSAVEKGDTIKLRTAPDKNLFEALKKKGHGLILQNHGMCAYGPTIESAYGLALTMEWCAQVQWHCMAAGKMNVLTDEQMEVAMEHYKTYGQKKSDGSHTGGYSVV